MHTTRIYSLLFKNFYIVQSILIAIKNSGIIFERIEYFKKN